MSPALVTSQTSRGRQGTSPVSCSVAYARPSRSSVRTAAFDDELRTQLWQWFERKLVVVEDYHATGEQIIDLIATNTPPGIRNRVMGIQNIKGTGLDFVYRWMAWQACFDACEQVDSPDRIVFRRALRLLGEFREFGVLSENRVREALQNLRNHHLAQNEDVLAQLELIQNNFETEMQRVHQELKGKQQQGAHFARFTNWLEEFMDATDAVRRRKAADRIYQDLAEEHISHDRAVVELRNLAQRQQGGWLK